MVWKRLIRESVIELKRKLPFLVIIIFLAGGVPSIIRGGLFSLIFLRFSYLNLGGYMSLVPWLIIFPISFFGFWFMIGSLIYSMEEKKFTKSLNMGFRNLHKIFILALIILIIHLIFFHGLNWVHDYMLKIDFTNFLMKSQYGYTELKVPELIASGSLLLKIVLNIVSVLVFFFIFSLPEIMIKKSGIIRALICSYKIARKNLKDILILYIIVSISPLILGIFPLVISFFSTTLGFIFFLFANAVAVIFNWILITKFYQKARVNIKLPKKIERTIRLITKETIRKTERNKIKVIKKIIFYLLFIGYSILVIIGIFFLIDELVGKKIKFLDKIFDVLLFFLFFIPYLIALITLFSKKIKSKYLKINKIEISIKEIIFSIWLVPAILTLGHIAIIGVLIGNVWKGLDTFISNHFFFYISTIIILITLGIIIRFFIVIKMRKFDEI